MSEDVWEQQTLVRYGIGSQVEMLISGWEIVLLEHGGTSFRSVGADGSTPMLFASHAEAADCVEALDDDLRTECQPRVVMVGITVEPVRQVRAMGRVAGPAFGSFP